jgi:hypothetical protein
MRSSTAQSSVYHATDGSSSSTTDSWTSSWAVSA